MIKKVKEFWVGQKLYGSIHGIQDILYRIDKFPTRKSVVLVPERIVSGLPSSVKIGVADLRGQALWKEGDTAWFINGKTPEEKIIIEELSEEWGVLGGIGERIVMATFNGSRYCVEYLTKIEQ